MIIVGIAGRKASGKDSVANALVRELGFERIAFADALKDLVASAFDLPREALDSAKFKEQEIGALGFDGHSQNITPRWLLQRIGTALHEQFDGDVWSNVVRDAITKRMLQHDAPPGFVIPDCRRFVEVWSLRSLYANVAMFLTPVGMSPAQAGHRIVIIRTNRADRMYKHGFKDDGDGATCGFSGTVIGPPASTFVCGLPRKSHPTHNTVDRHTSETELPDAGNLYDNVIETSSLELTARVGLDYVRALVGGAT